MLTTLCWPGSFSYDPIADPQNVSAETCVSDHLKPYIDDGINQIKDPFVSMGDEVAFAATPADGGFLARVYVGPKQAAMRSAFGGLTVVVAGVCAPFFSLIAHAASNVAGGGRASARAMRRSAR